jgi:hypothetical protein
MSYKDSTGISLTELTYSQLSLIREWALEKLNKETWKYDNKCGNVWLIENKEKIKQFNVLPPVKKFLYGSILLQCIETEDKIQDLLKNKKK